MAIFVGGDTSTFNFSPLTKVANSTADCPIRIFEANIPSLQAPYSPTDARWKEITDQSILDSLKYQDGVYKPLSVNTSLAETPVGDAVNNYVVKHNASADGTMNMELEGNTLVNLTYGKTITPMYGTASTSNGVTTHTINDISNNAIRIEFQGVNFKTSSTYTIMFEINPLKTISNANSGIRIMNLTANEDRAISNPFYTATANTWNKIIVKLDTKSTFTTTGDSKLLIYDYMDNTAIGDTIQFRNIMILEGDWTSKPIPAYFEGIKNLDTINVTSVGKNLLNVNDTNRVVKGTGTATIDSSNITFATTGNTNGLFWACLYYKGTVISTSASTTTLTGTYTFPLTTKQSSDYDFWIGLNGNSQDAKLSYPMKLKPNTTYTITVNISTNALNQVVISNQVLFEEGSTATTYEVYKSSTKSITLTNGINRLPNGMFDTITSDGRVLRNTGKVVLNGGTSEGWYIMDNTLTNTILFANTSAIIGHKSGSITDMVCDRIIVQNTYSLDNEGLFGSSGTPNQLYVRINKSKLSTVDVTGFKSWLASNPMTVIYQLDVPTSETTTALSLSSYKGGNLIVNTVIPPYVREWHTDSTTGYTSSTSKMSKQMMIEIDMSGITNGVYGGSNSSLKSGIKAINNDIWSMGSGSNAGVSVNGIKCYMWTAINTWSSLFDGGVESMVNTTSSITKMTGQLKNNADATYKTGTNNKIYILLSSTYASDTNIPSTLNVDYFNVRVDFTRVRDKMQTNLTLPSKWSILMKDLVPTWDANNSQKDRVFMHLFKDANNRSYLIYRYSSNKLNCVNFYNNTNVADMSTDVLDFTRFTSINLLYEFTGDKYRLRLIQNNKTVKKYEVASSGNKLQSITMDILNIASMSGGYEADAFVGKVILFNRNFDDDVQAEQILRGQYQGFEYEELATNGDFKANDLSGWTISGSPIVSKNKVTINSGDKLYQEIKVFPNNKYRFKATKDIIDGGLIVDSYYNNALLRSDTLTGTTAVDGAVVVPDYTNKVRLNVQRINSFTRGSNAYKLNGSVVSGNTPRLETGKFSNALTIEEGTTNTLSDATFVGQSGLASCFKAYQYGATVNYTIVDDYYIPNTKSQRLQYTSATNDGSQMNKGIYITPNLVSGQTYSLSFYGKGFEDRGTISFYSTGFTNPSGTMVTKDMGNGWKKYSWNPTANTTGVGYIYIRPNNNTEYSFDCLINAPLFENKSYATSFIDGTRNGDIFKIPKSVLNISSGTIEMFVKRSNTSINEQQLFDNRGSNCGINIRLANNTINLLTSNGLRENGIPSSVIAWDTINFHYIAVTWDVVSKTRKMYFDGALVASDTNWTDGLSFYNVNDISVGKLAWSNSYYANGLYDVIRISNIARSITEIQSVNASLIMPSYDSNTTFLFNPSELTQAVKMADISMKFEM